MSLRRLFREAVAGLRHRHVEPGPFPSAPSVSECDAGVMITDADRRRFEDVEFYGPNAEAANAGRAAAIARMDTKRIPAKATPPPPPAPPKKKVRRSKRERLETRAEKLRAEISRLRGRK